MQKDTLFRGLTLLSVLILTTTIILIFTGLILYPPADALIASLQSAEIQYAILLSLATALISTLLCIGVALPVSYTLSRSRIPGIRIITVLLNLPIALPPIVAGLALLIFFGNTPVGNALSQLGVDVIFTPFGIIVAQFFVNVPSMIRIFKTTFSSISPRYEHVARTLGCSDAGGFWHVLLPMSRRGIIAGTIITWSKAMGEFGAVLMLAGATRMKTETLPIALFLNMSTGDLELAIGAATILIVIAGITLYCFEVLDLETV